jgi:1-acyl-sn-glycerol-3-phosphate acyltransferase
VGNHNGGVLNTDSYMTLLAVWNHFGPDRVLCPLAHDLVFFDPVIAPIAARMGVLRAGHRSAAKAFDQGHMALVYPGSDLDSWRPFRDRGRIELGQRKGFLRLVLRHRIPIVPVVSAGTHEQFVVIARGDELARRSGIKRLLRAEAVPIVLALPWGITTGYLPYAPLPAQTTLQFGHSIRFDDVEPGQEQDAATLDRCYERVRDEMQALLDSLCEGRRWLFGQPRGEAR